MPAMSDITVDPYHENDPDLSIDAAKLESSTGWAWPSGSSSEANPESQSDLPSSVGLSLPSTSGNHGNGDDTTRDAPIFVGPIMGMLPESSCQPEYTRLGDFKDSSAESGVSGLRNLGNTCFMNAGIQCLVSNPRLAMFLLDEYQPENEEVLCNSLTGQFTLLLQKIWAGTFSVIHPSALKEILGLYHPQFKDYRQHDCQEFLALLLDSLHEQLNSGSSSAKHYDSDEEIDQSEVLDSCHSATVAQSPLILEVDSQSQVGNELEKSALVQVATGEHICSEKHGKIASSCTDRLSFASEDSCQSDMSVTSSSSTQVKSQLVVDKSPAQVSSTEVTSKDWNNQPNNAIPDMGTAGEQRRSVSMIENNPKSSTVASSDNKMDVDSVSSSSTHTLDPGDVTTNDVRKLPSLEDLYMKDTKTLNTNVLASDLTDEEDMAVDSEKFHKQENTSPLEVSTTQFDFEQLNDLLALDTTKGDGVKPFKDTNLLANMKEKFPDDLCSKKFLFSEVAEDEHYSINNIKRIKIDEEEKNTRMQSKLKVNVDKNATKVSNISTTTNLIHGASCSLPNNSDVLVQDVVMCSSGMSGDHISLSQGVQNRVDNQAWRPPSAQHMQMAEKEWRKHLRRHQSVIVDTFQGQFKSTVVCSECHHVSVTFEPFMYLSVPLPHAMERQISVIFVPCDNKQPVQYLLTLHKQDVVKRLKLELLRVVGEESCDVVIAEVFENHIARILEDHTMLRFLNDSNRTMYAFEMFPAPQIDEITDPVDLSDNHSNADAASPLNKSDTTTELAPNNTVSSSSNVSTDSAVPSSSTANTSLSTLVEQPECSTQPTSEITSTTAVVDTLDEQNRLNNSTENTLNQSWSSETDFKCTIDFQHNPLRVVDSTTDFQRETSTSNWLAENEAISSTNDALEEALIGQGAVQSEKDMLEEGGAVESAPTVTDQWKTCAICLEEMIDSDLMAHGACGGTLCQTCLEMTFKHYGDAGLMCPVCSTPVDPAQDFVQLDAMADYKPKTRILSIPVVHRLETTDGDGKKTARLFGHPNILYLPSNTNGEYLYAAVDRVVLCLGGYTVLLTDGQGYRCSRCLYTQHCAGCELPREGDIALQPGDHLAIKFSELREEQVVATQGFVDHHSMEGLLPSTPLTLFDCFQAFTQSEFLDEHNPWFCPRCKKNQCANKTMTVWKYPETLVVYLKRFVFHEMSGTKLDNKVVFPLEKLDVSSYISGPMTETLTYDLNSCVCHFGGVNSGHYTAYSKNCLTEEWTYFNDETMTKKQPQEDDYSNAYILFYQRQGTNVSFKVPEKLSQFAELQGFDDPQESYSIPPSSLAMSDFPGACSLPLSGAPGTYLEGSAPFDVGGRRSSDAGSMTTEADSSTACENFDYYS